MHPGAFPHDLYKKPRLSGEALVYWALQAALNEDWLVFYDRPIRGTRRRVDFIAANAGRGILAVEVKGGMVHDKRGSFHQLISKTGQRKRVDAFGQLKLGLDALFAAVDVARDAVPMHQAIWFPEMGQGGLRWEASPHILTRENLDAPLLTKQIDAALTKAVTELERAAIARIIQELSGKQQ